MKTSPGIAIALFVLASPLTNPAVAQHHQSTPTGGEAEPARGPSEPGEAEPQGGVLGIPMSRHGSGTAWLPDAAPMRGIMAMAGGWELMFHGNLFVGYNRQGTEAGGQEVVSQNWLMAMAGRPLAGGEFELRTMLSLEPLTVGRDGYRLLMQTGETYRGERLVDRQHPHDLFMELAARYSREVGGGVALELYAAPAGEPALGPVAFPHRPSATFDPMAPLVHHWQDSTHITYGVVTAGVFTRRAKLEGSWFNGREPDEDRYDLDLRSPDSYSTRVSVNPHRNWSMQASYGYLASPEPLAPEVSIQRLTASAMHTQRFGMKRQWSSTVAFGRNMPSAGPTTRGVLVETALELGGMLGTTYLRGEHVIKAGEDFAMPTLMADATLPIAALSLGHVHRLATIEDLDASLGIRGGVGYVDPALEERYGTRTPFGFMAYVQVQPSVMDMGH